MIWIIRQLIPLLGGHSPTFGWTTWNLCVSYLCDCWLSYVNYVFRICNSNNRYQSCVGDLWGPNPWCKIVNWVESHWCSLCSVRGASTPSHLWNFNFHELPAPVSCTTKRWRSSILSQGALALPHPHSRSVDSSN
jgi:hypothetical protein